MPEAAVSRRFRLSFWQFVV